MRITWYGHAAFLIETADLRIILDPFKSPDSGGYEPIGDPADIVAVSHENDRYHSHLGQIAQPFQVVRGLELPADGEMVKGIRFQAIHVFETPEKLPEDEVTILHFRSERLHVVHLGDLGHALTEAEIAPLRGADVLLASAGGLPTIEISLMPALIEAIGPKIIVPMHYQTPKINLKIQPVERLLEVLPDWVVDRPGTSKFEVGGERRIVLLDHAR